MHSWIFVLIHDQTFTFFSRMMHDWNFALIHDQTFILFNKIMHSQTSALIHDQKFALLDRMIYNNNNNNNSYILVTLIKSTHEKNLCYVCWVNKTLWDRKSLAVYTTATRSQDNKTETMYQICSWWLHVREWVFLSF